jgi:PAS domain S-box-containing protein
MISSTARSSFWRAVGLIAALALGVFAPALQATELNPARQSLQATSVSPFANFRDAGLAVRMQQAATETRSVAALISSTSSVGIGSQQTAPAPVGTNVLHELETGRGNTHFFFVSVAAAIIISLISAIALYILRIKRRLRRSIEQLSDTENRLRTLSTTVEQSPASVVITDLNTIIRYVNPEFSRVTGYTAAEVLGQRSSFLGSGQTQGNVFEDMWNDLAEGRQWSGEFINRRKNGEIYYEEAHMSAVCDSDGKITQYVAVKLDITARKRFEIEQQCRNRVLELLASGAALPIILEALVRAVETSHPETLCSILLLDHDGRHLLTGAAPSLPDFFNQAVNGTPIGLNTGSCGTAAFTGQRVIVEDIQQHPFWTPYRELAASATLGACWSEPIRSANGKILGTFAIYHRQPHAPSNEDIQLIEQSAKLAAIAIDRSQANEALRASEANYRFIYEAAPLAFILIDQENRIAGWNRVAESMFGWHTDEILGQSVEKLVFTEDLPHFTGTLNEAWASGEIVREMSRSLTAHGETIICEWSNAVQRDASGKAVGLLCLAHDVTAVCHRQEQLEAMVSERTRDLLAAKDAAERASRVKSEFIANLSHEIKTPMNGIIGMTELVLDTPLDEEQSAYLQTVKSSSETLMHLINGLLDFSALEGGKLSLSNVPFKLADRIDSDLTRFQGAAESKGLTLTLACAADLPQLVQGDPDKLGQALAILLDNAVKFTPDGAVALRITSSGRSENGQHIRFSVTDSGPGIPADKQQTLFEAFTQADGSASRRFGGIGLGLALCARLVDAMGGKLALISEPGAGSEFHFTLNMPAGDLPATAASTPHFDYKTALQAADPELLDIIGALFIDTWPNEIADIRSAIEEDNRKSLSLKAHSLKGNLAMFNADPAKDLAAALENMATTSERPALAASVDALEAELHCFQLALEAFLSEN